MTLGLILLPHYCRISRGYLVPVPNFVADAKDRNYDIITFILKYLYFKEVWRTFKDSIKVKGLDM